MWNTLFVISTGTKSAYDALAEFLQSISASEIDTLNEDECCRFWFRARERNPAGNDIHMEDPQRPDPDIEMPPPDERREPEPETPNDPSTPPPTDTSRDSEPSVLPRPHDHSLRSPNGAQPDRGPSPPPPAPRSNPDTGGGSKKKKKQKTEESIVTKQILDYYVSGPPCSAPLPF